MAWQQGACSVAVLAEQFDTLLSLNTLCTTFLQFKSMMHVH